MLLLLLWWQLVLLVLLLLLPFCSQVGCDWASWTVSVASSVEQNTSNDSRYGWRTRQQLLKQYNQDESVCDDIIARKIEQGLTMENPEAPGNDDARLYYVMVDLSQLNQTNNKQKMSITGQASVNGQQAALLAGSLSSSQSIPGKDGISIMAGGSDAQVASADTQKPTEKSLPAPLPAPGGDTNKRDKKVKKERVFDSHREKMAADLEGLAKKVAACKVWPVKLKMARRQSELAKEMEQHADSMEALYVQAASMLTQPDLPDSDFKDKEDEIAAALAAYQADAEVAGRVCAKAKAKAKGKGRAKAKAKAGGKTADADEEDPAEDEED